MYLHELLQIKDFALPMDLHGTFSDNLKDVFDKYLFSLRNLTPCQQYLTCCQQVNQRIQDIQNIADAVIESINLYLSNEIVKSKICLDNLLFTYSADFRNLITLVQTNESKSDQMRFFRVRKEDESGRLFSKAEMFHIPRGERHNCVTYRYSSPGIPGLYLGASSFVCWEEMRRSPISKLQIVELRMKKNASLTFLDLGYSMSFIGRLLENNVYSHTSGTWTKIIFPRILFFPLICAACIKTFYDKASFKEEYIIPQYLLETPKTNFGYDGIRYMSSRIDYNIYNSLLNTNFAFTADGLVTDDYSNKLLNCFDMSDVYKCKDLINHSRNPPTQQNHMTKIRLRGVMQHYDMTEFYKMDYLLSLSNFSKII